MSSTREPGSDTRPHTAIATATKSQMKIRDLARSCGWLEDVLQQQDLIMELLGALAASQDGSTWARRWTSLERAVEQHFRVEEDVLAPSIQAMGQRAHAVVADARRRQMRRGLEDVRYPSWEEDGARVWQLRLGLENHFEQEKSWSYHALARDHDDGARARLTAHCRQVLSEADGDRART